MASPLAPIDSLLYRSGDFSGRHGLIIIAMITDETSVPSDHLYYSETDFFKNAVTNTLER